LPRSILVTSSPTCLTFSRGSRGVLVRHVRHARFPRDMLATSSRGSHEDATRKLLPWNFSYIALTRAALLHHQPSSSPPTRNPRRLLLTGWNQTIVSAVTPSSRGLRIYMPRHRAMHYAKRRRHLQNRKYVTYRNAAPDEDPATVTLNIHSHQNYIIIQAR